LIYELKKQGIDLKSHMNSIDEETAELVLALFKAPPAVLSKEPPPPPMVPAERVEAPATAAEPAAPVEVQPAPPPEVPSPAVAAAPAPPISVGPHEVATPVESEPAVKVPADKRLRLTEAITVKELAEKIDARPADVIKALMKLGVMATINAVIDLEKATALAQSFGHTVEAVAADMAEDLAEEEEAAEQLVRRAPVVTVM